MIVEGGCTILHAWGLASFTHARQADNCKRLIADSYHNPSVFRCSELQFPDLTHHRCRPVPPMPTDETRPMDGGDGKPSRKSFSEDGRGGTKPVSDHRYSFYAVLCLDDYCRSLK